MDFPCPQHVLQGREQRTQGAWGGQGEGASQSMPVIIATHKQVKGVVGNRAPESRLLRPVRPAPAVCVHFVGWKSSDLSLLLASLLTLSHLDEFTRLAGPPAPPLSDERASSRATPLWVSEALAIKWCRADGSRGHTGRWTVPRLPHGPALSPASPAASLPVTLSVSSTTLRRGQRSPAGHCEVVGRGHVQRRLLDLGRDLAGAHVESLRQSLTLVPPATPPQKKAPRHEGLFPCQPWTPRHRSHMAGARGLRGAPGWWRVPGRQGSQGRSPSSNYCDPLEHGDLRT